MTNKQRLYLLGLKYRSVYRPYLGELAGLLGVMLFGAFWAFIYGRPVWEVFELMVQ